MIKPIAIYLPQFHSIPENDKAWGEGFTEWTNVKKAKPLFDGHYQPHVPHEDVGYYDLSDPEVLVKQAAMAKEYGIHGFAFYHYWFNGKRLLETPLDNMLKTGKPDFPFLYIWANENWTKRWDGLDNEIIIKQDYSHEDDLEHIQFLCTKVFSDKRYITIDDKPVFIVYRTEILPDIKETVRIWREVAKKYGFKDLYLIKVENFVSDIDPFDIGFDASMEFAPSSKSMDLDKLIFDIEHELTKCDYPSTIQNMLLKENRPYPWFRSICPGWDNTARRSKNGITYLNNTPNGFKQLTFGAVQHTLNNFDEDLQFIFINAWNEWGEGCHVEPDTKDGYVWLEVIKDIVCGDFDKNQTEYIEYLESNLKLALRERNDKKNELESLNILYKKFSNSNGHKIMESLLKRYRIIRSHFRR